MKKLIYTLAILVGGVAHADNWLRVDFSTKSCPQMTDDSGSPMSPALLYQELVKANYVPDVILYEHMGVKVVQITANKAVFFFTDDAGTCADILENNPKGPPDLAGTTDAVTGGSISLSDLN